MVVILNYKLSYPEQRDPSFEITTSAILCGFYNIPKPLITIVSNFQKIEQLSSAKVRCDLGCTDVIR